MTECYLHTDLEWRLAQIPDDAACRGVFFNMLDQRASEFGPDIQSEYRRFFKLYSFSGLRLYSVKDYLTRIVKLAEMRFGAANIYHGIFEIQAAAFPTWRRTLVGRAAFGIIGSEFATVMRIATRNTQKSWNYGSYDFFEDRPGHFVTR